MPHSQRLEGGPVNPIMPFSVLVLLWLGLTVLAFIAGIIARIFSAN